MKNLLLQLVLLSAIPVFAAFKNKLLSTAGDVSSAQVICPGDTPTDLSITGSVGSIQWQFSTDRTTWTDMAGGTGATITGVSIGPLTSSRFFFEPLSLMVV